MSVAKLTLDIEVVEPWTQVGDDIDGPANYDYLGYSVSMNTDGTRMAVGAPYSSTYFSIGGGYTRVYQYDQAKTPVWQQMGADIEGSMSYDGRGSMVSISGDGTRIASYATFVMVHEWDSDSQTWTSISSGLPGAGGALPWGFAISSDGKRVACFSHVSFGAPYKLTVYEVDSGGTWTLLGNTPEIPAYPKSVALSANGYRVVVGLPDMNPEQVLVYELDSGTNDWETVGGEINGPSDAEFGTSVAISADGTRVVVGMPGVSGPCGIHTNIANVAPFVRVYQFEVASLSWEKLGSDMTIEPSTENGHCYGYYFGYSVDMADDGSLIAIRADKFAFDAAKSRVHLYSLDADTNDWVKAGGDILDDAIDDTAISGSYGTPTDVSLSGDGKYVAIGAHLNDNVMTDGGSVRVYKDPSAAAPSPASPSGSCSSSLATGGTVTTSGEYTIHTFTSSGTFEVTDSTLTAVDALVVGGGAGGTGGDITSYGGAGGGGGEVLSASGMIVSKRGYSVTVGDGGNGETPSYISATTAVIASFTALLRLVVTALLRRTLGGASGSGKSGGNGDDLAGGGGAGAGSNGADVSMDGVIRRKWRRWSSVRHHRHCHILRRRRGWLRRSG